MQTKEVLEAMRDDYRAGEVEILKADGGASQNDLLLQIQADHLQVCKTAPSHFCPTLAPRPKCQYCGRIPAHSILRLGYSGIHPMRA